MYPSTYYAEYISETQSVLLTDAVNEVDVFSMEYHAFHRLTQSVFGDERTKKIITALCSYRKVTINWALQRVGIDNTVVDVANEFFKRAMDPATIETLMFDTQGGVDVRELEANLMGIQYDA